MGTKSTTYKINIQASYDSLVKMQQELNKIKSQGSDLGFGTKDYERLEEILIGAKRLQELMDKKTDENMGIDASEFKEIDKLFNSFIRKTEGLSKSLIQLFSQDLQKSIEEADAKIEATRKKKQTANLEKGRATIALNKATNEITAQQTAGVVDEKGQSYSKTSDFKKRIDQIMKRPAEDISASEKKLLDIWENIQKLAGPALEKYKQDWDAAEKKVEEANQTLKEQIELKNKLTLEGVAEIPNLTPGSESAINNFHKAIDGMNDSIDTSEKEFSDMQKAQTLASNSTNASTRTIEKNTAATDKNRTTLGKAIYNVVSYGSALRLVRSVSTKFISTIKEMDKALTDMTVVTQLSREQAWELTGQLQSLATQTGMTATEVAQMTTMYLQQGKTLTDALTMTEVAAKAARIAGISGSESISLLTNAMNGFHLSADQAMEVSDKFAALAASAATNYEGLATALSKVAAQANLAGMSMDFTLGLLTKGIEVTQEAPETIGTALKTVISRMRELTDYGETLEDGVDVNRVDTALKNIGVNLLDSNREFRNLDEVLTEVGEKWDTLNKNQQANVAVALAGTRFNETMACAWAA